MHDVAHKGRVSGFALPAVMVISVLVMTVTAMALSMLTMDSRVYREYHRNRQRMIDLESALVVYSYDSGIFSGADTAVLKAHSGSGDDVSLVRKDWGLYECVSAHDGYGNSVTRLYGKVTESPEAAAFWICDRNRALTLAAGAGIYGTAYIPPNGVNYSGDIQDMHLIPDGMARVSLPEMPPLDSSYHVRFRRMFGVCTETVQGDSVFMLDRMSVLHGDEVCISGESVIHDAVICARKVTVRDGFRGSMQIFCTDSVCLEPGVRLEWPSGICVASESGFPNVVLGDGCRIDGYVVVTGAGPDYELIFPGYVQRQGAVLNGLLYADCSCEIEGDIAGAAYVRDCCHREDGVKYPGTVASARITRDGRLAFPILMEGSYARKAIKNMNKK